MSCETRHEQAEYVVPVIGLSGLAYAALTSYRTAYDGKNLLLGKVSLRAPERSSDLREGQIC